MKLLFMLICILQVNCLLKAQQRTKEVQHILLRLMFPPFYNSYSKSCCKLYPRQCYKLLDNSGYTCDSLKGRVTTTEEDGWIEFRISNVQVGDAGHYRCGVLGTQTQIYTDYYVEVLKTSDHYSESRAPLTTTATFRAPTISTMVLESTVPVMVQDSDSDNDSASLKFNVPLLFTVFIIAMIFVASVIGAVCCKVKARRKKSNVFGETLYDSQKQECSETSGIVYATVDFKPHQKPEEVYENLREHKTRAGLLDVDNAGAVEYSTLAFQL